MTHKRLMYLLLIASLIAFILGCTHGVHLPHSPGRGMSDGGGL